MFELDDTRQDYVERGIEAIEKILGGVFVVIFTPGDRASNAAMPRLPDYEDTDLSYHR